MKDLKDKILAFFAFLVINVGILTVGYILLELAKEAIEMLGNIFS